jgi:hypothetical protein
MHQQQWPAYSVHITVQYICNFMYIYLYLYVCIYTHTQTSKYRSMQNFDLCACSCLFVNFNKKRVCWVWMCDSLTEVQNTSEIRRNTHVTEYFALYPCIEHTIMCIRYVGPRRTPRILAYFAPPMCEWIGQDVLQCEYRNSYIANTAVLDYLNFQIRFLCPRPQAFPSNCLSYTKYVPYSRACRWFVSRLFALEIVEEPFKEVFLGCRWSVFWLSKV